MPEHELTDDEINEVQQSWDMMVRSGGGLRDAGLVLNKQLLTAQPHHIKSFEKFKKYKDMDDIFKSPEFQQHSYSTVREISLVIDNLKHAGSFTELTRSIGFAHRRAKTPPNQMLDFKNVFINDFIPSQMADRATPNTIKAWEKFMTVFIDNVREGLEMDVNPSKTNVKNRNKNESQGQVGVAKEQSGVDRNYHAQNHLDVNVETADSSGTPLGLGNTNKAEDEAQSMNETSVSTIYSRSSQKKKSPDDAKERKEDDERKGGSKGEEKEKEEKKKEEGEKLKKKSRASAPAEVSSGLSSSCHCRGATSLAESSAGSAVCTQYSIPQSKCQSETEATLLMQPPFTEANRSGAVDDSSKSDKERYFTYGISHKSSCPEQLAEVSLGLSSGCHCRGAASLAESLASSAVCTRYSIPQSKCQSETEATLPTQLPLTEDNRSGAVDDSSKSDKERCSTYGASRKSSRPEQQPPEQPQPSPPPPPPTIKTETCSTYTYSKKKDPPSQERLLSPKHTESNLAVTFESTVDVAEERDKGWGVADLLLPGLGLLGLWLLLSRFFGGTAPCIPGRHGLPLKVTNISSDCEMPIRLTAFNCHLGVLNVKKAEPDCAS